MQLFNAKKTVIIVGMVGAWEGDPCGAEIWGVNWSYKVQSNLTRLFFMDPLEVLVKFSKATNSSDFVSDINALGIPVIAQEQYPELHNCQELPFDQISHRFGLPPYGYFTSTVSYMLALAIFEGFEKIIIHRIFVDFRHREYREQKSCLEFWIGIATGLGIEVEISDDSCLGKPYPWQSPQYGKIYMSPDESAMQKTLMQHGLKKQNLAANMHKVPTAPPPKAAPAPAAPDQAEKPTVTELKPCWPDDPNVNPPAGGVVTAEPDLSPRPEPEKSPREQADRLPQSEVLPPLAEARASHTP